MMLTSRRCNVIKFPSPGGAGLQEPIWRAAAGRSIASHIMAVHSDGAQTEIE